MRMKTPNGELWYTDLEGSLCCVWAGRIKKILGSEDLDLCRLLLNMEFSEPLLSQKSNMKRKF